MSIGARVKRSTSDTLVLFHRNALRYQRMPEVLVFLVIQPVIVLLLFRYILGGAVHLRGVRYLEYLMPGVFALAVVNGSATSCIGLARDLESGTVDRLRTLPIARSAFLAARSLIDIVRNMLIIPLVGVIGIAVGFNMTTTLPHVLLAFALLLGLGSAIAWLATAMALWLNSVEATQTIAITLSLVASFACSGFVPVATMSPWLRGVVGASPVTYVDNAVRMLLTGTAGNLSHDVLLSLGWIVAIVAISMPVAVMRYTRHSQ
jgi:ABC-2 type transport system permease protein